jgi:hypothetical protein
MALESLDAIEELLGKGNILILTELHSDIETTTLQERLTERGFHVLEDIELQARAHKLIGVSAFSDALTHHELRGFMKKEQRIAGIVLVEGTRDGERVCRTVVPLR